MKYFVLLVLIPIAMSLHLAKCYYAKATGGNVTNKGNGGASTGTAGNTGKIVQPQKGSSQPDRKIWY